MERTFDRVAKAMVLGIRDLRDLMFTESQRIVNVDRGTLKKSGFTKNLPDGAEFGYRAPYAARVNFGLPKGYTEAVRRHRVRAHRRRLARASRRYVKVREHYRGPFKRVYAKGVKGSQFMERSVDKFMPQAGKVIGRRIRQVLS